MSLGLFWNLDSLHDGGAVRRQAKARSIGRQLSRIELVPGQATGEARVCLLPRHLNRPSHQGPKDVAAGEEAIALKPALYDLQTRTTGAVNGVSVAVF